jgi:hypothetical protein
MQTVTTIGLDIAKSVFQVHGVDAAGQVLIRRQLKRRAVLAFFQKLPVCLVGIEACASGAARPLPPSADIGPGGQSVGQAAQFCLAAPTPADGAAPARRGRRLAP